MTDVWLETDVSVENAGPLAGAQLIKSVAQTMRDAPDGVRYDVELVVRERDAEGDGDD